MSKLIFSIFSVILIAAVLTVQNAESKSRPARTIQAWGKARGDVMVRIVERDAGNGYVTLDGEVQTPFDSVEVEWKLPDGAVLTEGTATATLTKTTDSQVLHHRVTVKVGAEISKPHIVFAAYTLKDGERIGHSRVFNLVKTEEQRAQTQEIRQMMKRRQVQPVQ